MIRLVGEFLVDTEALLSAHAGPHFERARRRGWDLYVSAASLERLARRRVCPEHVRRWVERLLREYPASVLSIDGETAWLAGRLRASHRTRGEVRALIAACALLHGLTIVTPRPDRYAGWGVRTDYWGRGP